MRVEQVNLSEYVSILRKSALKYGAFASPEMLEVWWDHRGRNKRFLGLVLLEDHRPYIMLPLYYARSRTVVRFCGHGFNNVVSFPHAGDITGQVVQTTVNALTNAGPFGVWDILDVPDGTGLFAALRCLEHYEIASYPCPFTEIGGEWECTYKRILNSKRRREIRIGLEKLNQRSGLVHLLVNSATVARLSDAFNECVRLHRKRFEGKYNTSGFSSPDGVVFYRDMLNALVPRDLALLSCLYVGDRMVSFIMGVFDGGTFIDVVPAFDPDYADYSPGHVNLYMLMQYLNQHGYERFDFSKGDSAYKQKWASGVRWQYHFVVPIRVTGYALKATSVLLTAKDHARQWGLTSYVKRTLGRIVRRR